LKTVKAASDVSSKVATPTTEAAAHAALPAPTPTAESDADRAPARSAFRMISAVSGPGVMIRTTATASHAKKRPSTGKVIAA
jgi:methionine-rich copper-binding protein CopC